MPFTDERARLLTRPAYTDPFRGPGAPLANTSGILFPYTPNISVAHQVEYGSYELVGTNYQQHSYGKTRNPQIQVTANFINQTPDETEYTTGVIHFLRVVTKMEWGNRSSAPGTPPPVLDFSAYGLTNFENVPVVVQGFNIIYEDGVDYVSGPDNTYLPSFLTLAIDLLPTYSPNVQQEFSLQAFANGSLYGRGFI